MQRIAVVDYKMGNIRSVVNALHAIAIDNIEVVVTSDISLLENADKIIFPGQGAAKDCMLALKQRNLDKILPEQALQKPFLGICMGLQVLLTYSQENQGIDCLDIFPGEVKYFGDCLDKQYKIPHMGWNQVSQKQAHPLWHNIPDQSRFYFVHSYYVAPKNTQTIVGTCEYGMEFPIGLAEKNIFAVQFHPEKSAHHGLQLLKNFLDWQGES